MGGQYTDFIHQANNPIVENGQTVNGPTRRWLRNLADLRISIASGQLDYQRSLAGKARLEAGLRFSRITNRSDADFLISDDSVAFRPDDDLSAAIDYTENISAGYLGFQSPLGESTELTLGLRAEYTDYLLTVAEEADQGVARDYLNFFPQASLSRRVSERIDLSLIYSSRIRRPAYQSLNPNLIYQDPFTSIQGNPNLIPEKIHLLELVGKLGPTTLKLGYNHTRDPLGGGAIRGEDSRSYVLKRLNFSRQNEWYASVTRSLSLGRWSSTNTATVSYAKVRSFEVEFGFVEPRPQPYFFTDQRLQLTEGLALLGQLYYVGELREGTFTRYDNANLTLTLEQKLLRQALTLRFIAADVFTTVRASGDYRIGETDIYFDNRWRSHYFRLSVSYDFGKLRESRFRNRRAGEAEGERI